jgi:hypothetical protein
MKLRTLCSRWIASLAVLAAVLVTAPAFAGPGPVLFGPKTFERTAGPPNHTSDTFDVPVGLIAVVWIQNGDGDGNRATSAQVAVNGTTVAGPSDFNKQIDLIAKTIAVPKGTATLDVSLAGEPGSVITITVMVQGHRPDISVGRLIVPYASGTGLTLALKNGSRHPREVKVMFYDDGGNVVASSERFELPSHGSLSQAAAGFISEGGFTSGSIEIVWAGFGVGRVFGQATVHDDLTGVDSITEMQQAGFKRIDPTDPNLKIAR